MNISQLIELTSRIRTPRTVSKQHSQSLTICILSRLISWDFPINSPNPEKSLLIRRFQMEIMSDCEGCLENCLRRSNSGGEIYQLGNFPYQGIPIPLSLVKLV